MEGQVKVELCDLTLDSDEEIDIKTEPVTPVKQENPNSPDAEPQDSSDVQLSPNGRSVRNIDKSMDKAIAEIKRGQSLVSVASHYGIPQEVLYNKLISRSLPRETDILTSAEESNLVKWVVKSNKSNTLIFKQHLMEKVGKLKKVMNITPIFAKSKFGRMWYEYFMKTHPEIYENDGLIMPSERLLVQPLYQNDQNKKPLSTPEPEDFDILTLGEEKSLVDWILTSNKNNSLIFKFQLMRRVGKFNKVAKSNPSFAKSKFGRIWYERFLKKHPEIYENDELLLPSQNEFNLDQLQQFYGITDSVVVLRDFRKDTNSPYKLNEKGVYVHQSIETKTEIFEEQLDRVKKESLMEYLDIKDISDLDYQSESGIESDQSSFIDDEFDAVTSINRINDSRGLKRKSVTSNTRPVCKECARSFCNFAKLRRHMLSIHQKDRQVACLECDKPFPSSYHLSVHVRNVHSSTYHECEYCGKKFKHRTSLRHHQRKHHEGLKSLTNMFYCDICKKGFKYKNSLEDHIIYGHLKEEKRFSCNICQKNFIKHSLMLRHRLRHSKVKPLECTHCGKTYSRKYLLREHIEGCAKLFKKRKLSRIVKKVKIEVSYEESEMLTE